MTVYTRFFGQRGADDDPAALVATVAPGDRPGFQVLFETDLFLDPVAITQAMVHYHPSMEGATCELSEGSDGEGKLFGLVGWHRHIIQLLGRNRPLPAEAVEWCVAPSHYSRELKDRARAHKSHVLLWYAGHETRPMEQFVALAAFVGVLERFGGLVVLNEAARTSLPAAPLSVQVLQSHQLLREDMLEILRALPLPNLYCGFVKFDLPGDSHVWMRTYGAHLLELPDLAAYTRGHHEGQRHMDMFDSILRYMLNTGRRIAIGDTMQIGAEEFLRCRAPSPDEPWLKSQGEMLVVEVIGADQINLA